MKGGTQLGAGRPKLPNHLKISISTIPLHITTKEKLREVPGNTWEEKIKFLLKDR